MSFKFSTNFLLSCVRKPAKYGGLGSTGLDATPTVQIHICHPVHKGLWKVLTYVLLGYFSPKNYSLRLLLTFFSTLRSLTEDFSLKIPQMEIYVGNLALEPSM